MPSGNYMPIPFVLMMVREMKPKTILDVGIGTGKYGMLFREYLDIWETDKPYNERNVQIDGVEVFPDYRTPVWDMYDNVYIGNVTEVKEIENTNYDLLFISDVIEHLTEEEAQGLFNRLNYKHVIVVTPLEVSGQKTVYGNKHEEHITQWDKNNMGELNYCRIDNMQVFWR